MNFSNRINNIKASPIRRLIPYADRARERGLEVIPLNIGQPDIDTPPDFLEAVRKFDVSVLEYANSRGIKKALETTQLYLKNYGLDFDLNEILITNGASEGLLFSLMALLDQGDEVISIEPFYTNYKSLVQMVGGNLRAVSSRVSDNFMMPKREEFEKLITPKTKVILLSSPSNPTGRVYREEEIRTIVDLAIDYDLFILADEVYREFNYTGRKFVSFGDFEEIEDRVCLLDSISKKYSACGARIGSIASKNEVFIKHVLKLCQARLAVSTLDQVGAGAMDLVDDEYVYANRRIYKRRRDILNDRLNKIVGIKASVPEGAFYDIVRLPVDNAEKFIIWTCENIQINKSTILLTPAEDFYYTEGSGRDEVRISYCVNEDKLELGMDILEKALREYKIKDIG